MVDDIAHLFKRPGDLAYLRFLRRLHRRIAFDWYLEIGSRTGSSASEVQGKTICVDPYFLIERNVIGAKPAFLAFQTKSDDFFQSKTLEGLAATLSFSFLDGMHLVEYLLRDFMNAEAHSAKGSVIAMHDCCPFNLAMTTRDVANAPRGAWTGDVWKIIPILQRYRPDLRLTVLGCRPTGLVLVHGLNPGSTVLKENLDDILAEWVDVELADHGVDTFYDSFAYTPVSEVIAEDFPMFRQAALDHTIEKPGFVSP